MADQMSALARDIDAACRLMGAFTLRSADVHGRVVTLIEDVITTGGAVRNAAVALRELGAEVDTVVCAIDRSEPSQNILSTVGVATRFVLDKKPLDTARE